ncbi:hybrid sensor histidine kinase/response regulator [Novosphingobium sp. 9]|uniref:hybrid sensor histidine kinase/response regulator n=1 Tax=Novosphingobium sp. 9 TaxID=2025349 RepID=UPI0021B69C99|nr:hybrid sensor histidine kinase/response regulator [Novosphingobium sp. 9]
MPIIFVTAGGSDLERRFRGYEAGAVDFISKPIEPTVLQGKVRVFLDLYRQRQQIAAQRDDLVSAAAALQQADRAKDHFLAVLAHELRNPLAALKSGLNLLGKPRGQQQAETIRSEMDRMLGHLSRLVDDLLDISRITEGKVILQLERVRLDDVVQSAIAGSRHRFEEAGHEFCVTMPDQHVWLEADHTRLAQVLANLLGNAAKYTPASGIIRLDCDVEDNEVVLRVQDTGIGIPLEMQKHIFEVFAQIDAHREHSQGGLGIGLALVRKLVSLHGGNIEVASEGIDKGSTFTVRLPLSGKDDRLSPRS